MMLNSGMPMNRMQQQQQQQPGMNCPPGSTNGQGLMTNGSDLQQQQQMSMNPQSFASNQYHQVRRRHFAERTHLISSFWSTLGAFQGIRIDY